MGIAGIMIWAVCMVFVMGLAEIGRLYDNHWRRMYLYNQGKLSRKQLRNLASILMIEADGGDSPVDFLEWAIEESKK